MTRGYQFRFLQQFSYWQVYGALLHLLYIFREEQVGNLLEIKIDRQKNIFFINYCVLLDF
ncbi:hypothetical protein CK934_02215 [Chitinophaga sp. MD30]|nr:hypothetical protein CK934_02215 [Chitinophaga sp. MD30]